MIVNKKRNNLPSVGRRFSAFRANGGIIGLVANKIVYSHIAISMELAR
jgi:hypothetical protein